MSEKSYEIKQTEEFVKNKLMGEHTGHDWWHIHRVRNLALKLAEKENADLYIVELAALLHDIADWKFTDDKNVVRDWLKSISIEDSSIEKITKIIDEISFKGAGVITPMSTIEGQCVQDADRLDAIGAIGVARCFAYGASKQREIYNPEIKPVMHTSFEQYKKSEGTSLNHFYEKLFLLKDRMNTQTGKDIAEQRHKFMENYVEQFLKEWNND